ncbi:hypothetical protein EZV62_002240 [Acer yangbiense]|uniref:CCHC-type domain-containing protein n=1 Tax=Acer yangbiense TaxID=1000413 RepID=A0A5C7IWJ4_9ROSI|nr:hypothetical protein EZV62_002240 [Acer yangbiense]
MSEAEIAKLYENLSLADEDVAVHEMAEEVKIDGVEDVERCLVGKVLAEKKVNRDAFKGLIEQIWNPFGHVEIELVGDNIFMFYFINSEDRNKVWHRGPWHFGNSLIVLEKPAGTWKFIRVNVRIDISKPLKRWLKLKLGKTEEVTRVNLKYERLPEFCFTCGRIGHGIKGCMDEEARKTALEGSPNKFGSWLKATISDRSKLRGNVQAYGSSSDRTRISKFEQPAQTAPIKLDQVVNLSPAQDGVSSVQPMEAEPSQSLLTSKKKIAKHWKRAAREVKKQPLVGLISSPLHRILEINKQSRKSPKDGFCWRFFRFYGDPVSSRRKFLWALLRRLREVDNLPWVCAGDFNEILGMSEKEGGSAKSFSDMYNFRQIVDNCNLFDLGFTGPKYTWNNKKDGSNNIQERLDRFLANDLRRDNFSNVNMTHLGFDLSNYCPILLKSDRNSKVFHAKATARKKKNFISNLMDLESNPQDTEDVFHSLAFCFNSNALSLVCMLVWVVWENRNSFVNNGKANVPERVVARAVNFLAEFKNSLEKIDDCGWLLMIDGCQGNKIFGWRREISIESGEQYDLQLHRIDRDLSDGDGDRADLNRMVEFLRSASHESPPSDGDPLISLHRWCDLHHGMQIDRYSPSNGALEICISFVSTTMEIVRSLSDGGNLP